MTDRPEQKAKEKTFRLMYRSRDRLPADSREDELAELFARARSDNHKQRITGALLLSGRRFVQVLEGDKVAVRSLFSRIQADPRHDEVELLFAEPVDSRTFARWSMARASMPDSAIPLISQLSEVTPVGPPMMTPDKSRLVDMMRQAIDEPPAT